MKMKMNINNVDFGGYILVDKVPVPERNIIAWGQFMQEEGNKIIKQEDVQIGRKKFMVSTVFLGIASNPYGAPRLFETMVFRLDKSRNRMFNWGAVDWSGIYQDKYCDYEEAKQGHQDTVDNLEMITACRRKRKRLMRKEQEMVKGCKRDVLGNGYDNNERD